MQTSDVGAQKKIMTLISPLLLKLFLVNWKIYKLYHSAVRDTYSPYTFGTAIFTLIIFLIAIDIPIITFSACMSHYFEVFCFVSSGKHAKLEILIFHVFQRIQALSAVG